MNNDFKKPHLEKIAKDMHHSLSLLVLPGETQSLSRRKTSPSAEHIKEIVFKSFEGIKHDTHLDGDLKSNIYNQISKELSSSLFLCNGSGENFSFFSAEATLNKHLGRGFRGQEKVELTTIPKTAENKGIGHSFVNSLLENKGLLKNDFPTSEAVEKGLAYPSFYKRAKRNHLFFLWDDSYLKELINSAEYCRFEMLDKADDVHTICRTLEGILGILNGPEESKEFCVRLISDLQHQFKYRKIGWHLSYHAIYELMMFEQSDDLAPKAEKLLADLLEYKNDPAKAEKKYPFLKPPSPPTLV